MRLLTLLTAFVGLAGMAIAQAAVEDTDGDGTYSMAEMQSAYPDLTVDVFAKIDVNEDGAVDPEELAAATAAGLLGG